MTLPVSLEPDGIDLPKELDFYTDENLPQYAPLLTKLTTVRRQILFELITNMVSDDKQTDGQIAAHLGIDRKTVYRARQNPVFSTLLSMMARDITKGLADRAIGNLVNMKSNVKAQEILLRIAEVYNPTQRILALTGKLPQDMTGNVTSPQQILDRFVTIMAGLGYDLTRLTDEIGQKWDELKANGQI